MDVFTRLSNNPNQELYYNCNGYDFTVRIHEFRGNYYVDAYIDNEIVVCHLPLTKDVKIFPKGVSSKIGGNLFLTYPEGYDLKYSNFAEEEVGLIFRTIYDTNETSGDE